SPSCGTGPAPDGEPSLCVPLLPAALPRFRPAAASGPALPYCLSPFGRAWCSTEPVEQRRSQQHAAQSDQPQLAILQPGQTDDSLAPAPRTEEGQDALQHQQQTE